MGVLPLEFRRGETPETLGLTGRETFDITGIADGLEPRCTIDVKATAEDGREINFQTDARLDSDVDVEYYTNGGILQTVLRKMVRGEM
jgi:aconitate hydratase